VEVHDCAGLSTRPTAQKSMIWAGGSSGSRGFLP
jgi:hypothetical protein